MPHQSLAPILEGRRSQPHQLVEVLQDVQKLHGYISPEAVREVSEGLGVPVIDVCRVAHFYKAFSLKPRGKHVITLCLGTACHVRGGNPLLHQALGLLGVEPGGTTRDGLFTVESVNCLGACALGPVAVVDGAYHHHMTPSKLRTLIQSLRPAAEKGGKRHGQN